FFDLDMLHKAHGFIEHDGSLSRADMFFDTSNKLNPPVFDNFVSYFNNSKTINTASLANARARHAYDMSLANPEFRITQASITVILGENAMFLSIFGGAGRKPLARRDWVEYFFCNERLPVKLDWTPPSAPIGEFVGVTIDELIAQSPAGVPFTFSPTNTTATL
ncbi:hypothetical protein EK21DRAFT_61941, partial [Setomelanomma holmii]